MPDGLTPAQRSHCMSRIRSKDTTPELVVRSLLHRLGYRFRLHVRELPGTPDVVLPRYRKVIEVKGCFWHQHACGRVRSPKSRTDYWAPKLLRNRQRDRQTRRQLRRLGWTVLTVWECQTKNTCQLSDRLLSFLQQR